MYVPLIADSEIVLVAMFLSVGVCYAVIYLNNRMELHQFPEAFVSLVLLLLNLQCGKRSKK